MAEGEGDWFDDVFGGPPRTFRRYPEYRDSGVEWLGEVPVGWRVERIRHIVQRIEQGWSPDCENREAELGEWGVLKAGCVNRGAFVESENKALPGDLSPPRELEISEGDLLMSRASGSKELVGSVALVHACRTRLLLCDKVFRLHPEETADRRFLALALNSGVARAQIEVALSGGSGLANNISQQFVKDLTVALPDRPEQRTIATFLHRESAKLDALIAKKERLIELLQEKRSALITRAVTKGLDPNVPMKDSGVEWLGEIPAHWEITRLGRCARIGNGSTPNRDNLAYWAEGVVPWLTSAKINDRIITSAAEFVTDQALRECHLPFVPANSVLVAITGEGQTRGRSAMLGIASTISQHLAFVTPSHVLAAEYAWRWLESRYGWLRAESSGAGSTRAALTCELLSAQPIPLPPLAEQKSIGWYLERQLDSLDAAVRRIEESAKHLHELRSALITAAVTGKIDVREEVA